MRYADDGEKKCNTSLAVPGAFVHCLRTPSMRKVDHEGENMGGTGKKRNKIMMFIVVANLVASGPPEH